MTGERGWRRLGLGACTAALVLGGCAGGEAAGDDDPPATSPLAEILGWGMTTDRAGPPEVTDLERLRHHRVEELIAECMAGHGFEYVPVSLADRMSGPHDEAYALDPVDFAAQYGYGVTTLSRSEHPAAEPNQAIVDRLPAPRQQAYHRALFGAAAVADPNGDTGHDGPEPAAPDRGQGCQAWANGEVYGQHGATGMGEGQARFAELLTALDRLWERIENDPRLAGAAGDWSDCMSDAGYPGFSRPHAAQQSVFDRHAALHGGGQEPEPAALAALRDYELALAPVDQACREEHIEGPRRRVAHELEAEFVTQHRAELEAYRDWLAGSRPDGG